MSARQLRLAYASANAAGVNVPAELLHGA